VAQTKTRICHLMAHTYKLIPILYVQAKVFGHPVNSVEIGRLVLKKETPSSGDITLRTSVVSIFNRDLNFG
jgi:hypothetical protein